MLGLSAREKEEKLVNFKIDKLTEEYVKAIRELQKKVEGRNLRGVLAFAELDNGRLLQCGDAGGEFVILAIERAANKLRERLRGPRTPSWIQSILDMMRNR